MTAFQYLPLSLPVAFVLGLASTLHCWGMCGGIIGAFSLGVPAERMRGAHARLLFPLAFNAGRVLSYGAIGTVAGLTGMVISGGTVAGTGYLALQVLAGALLVLIGLNLCGWTPALHAVESLGLPLWRRIQPLGRRLLPIDRIGKALLMGMLWGWIPCGLVYAVALWTISTADPAAGAATLFTFGLGTLPGMTAAGVAGTYARTASPVRGWRRAAGVLLILLGILSPAVKLYSAHAGHGVEEHVHGKP